MLHGCAYTRCLGKPNTEGLFKDTGGGLRLKPSKHRTERTADNNY